MLRLYRSLLYLYPADYRREFGNEMAAVYLQAQNVAASGRVTTRTIFYAREMVGLISGAVRGHVRRLFGDWVPFRRFNMRPGFRFPRSTVFLMTVVLAGVILAIKKAHDLTAFRLDINFASTLVSFFVAFLLMCAAGGAAWGILFALRRSGVHRLDSIQTWPERH